MPAHQFNPFVVVYGGEDLLIDRYLRQARASKRYVISLEGEGLKDVDLVELCEAYDERPRTLVLDNAQGMKGEKAFESFLTRRVAGDKSLILVAAYRGSKLPELWKKAGKLGQLIEHAELKAYDDKAFSKFIEGEARSHGVSIGVAAVEKVLERVGPDLYRLANEMQKLAVFVGRLNEIKPEHVTTVTSATPRTDPFVIADLVTSGDRVRAVSRFGLLCASESESKAMLTVMAALMKKHEQMASIRALLDQKLSEEDIAGQLGLHPWVYRTRWLPLVEKVSLSSLVRKMSRLCQLDEYVKSGQPSKRAMFELTLLDLAN